MVVLSLSPFLKRLSELGKECIGRNFKISISQEGMLSLGIAFA